MIVLKHLHVMPVIRASGSRTAASNSSDKRRRRDNRVTAAHSPHHGVVVIRRNTAAADTTLEHILHLGRRRLGIDSRLGHPQELLVVGHHVLAVVIIVVGPH